MADTKIAWTEKTWNVMTGCTKVSPACTHCYAERMAERLRLMGQPKYTAGFAPTFHPEALNELTRWRKPCRVFVNSMSDTFHEAFTDQQIAQVFGRMAAYPEHTFQVLTKRPERMRAWMQRARPDVDIPWPPRNVWFGTTVEDQQRAEERIPHLLATPAVVRFVSIEPMLRLTDLRYWLPPWMPQRPQEIGLPPLDWVICGGESGPNARPMDPNWARSLRDQCAEAGVPFFFKQWSGRNPKQLGRELDGREWNEYPKGH